MNTTIDRKFNFRGMQNTIDRKFKFSAKYLSYARKSGCIKFVNNGDCRAGKLNTLDKNITEEEVVKYLFETSNWFLFEKDHKFLNVIDTFSE